MTGGFFAVISTVCFGFHNAAIRRGVLGAAAGQALYITVFLGVPVLLAAAVVSGQLGRVGAISPSGYLSLGMAGVVHFLFGRYCNYRAVAAIGSNRASPFMGTSFLFSVGFAVLLQGETVTPLGLTGMGLMFVAPLLLVGSGFRRRPEVPAGSGPGALRAGALPLARLVEGYAFAMGSALGYGSSPNFVRAGLEGTGLGVLGGLASYATAALILAVTMLQPGRFRGLAGVPAPALRWFLGAAFSISFAQMFRYVALGMAPVTLVASLGQLSPVFSLVFGFLINREFESFAPRVLIGIVLSVAGSVLLILAQ